MPRDITRAQPPEPTLGFIPSCPAFLGLGKGERLRSSSWGERDRLPPPPGPAAVRVAFLFSHGSLGAEHELLCRGEGDAVAAWHMSQSSVGRGTPREQHSPSTFWESPPLPEPAPAGLKPPPP